MARKGSLFRKTATKAGLEASRARKKAFSSLLKKRRLKRLLQTNELKVVRGLVSHPDQFDRMHADHVKKVHAFETAKADFSADRKAFVKKKRRREKFRKIRASIPGFIFRYVTLPSAKRKRISDRVRAGSA